MLLTYTKKIFDLIEENKTVMQANQIPSGPLAIGSMETTAAVRLPSLLANYHKDYPDVDLTLNTGSTEQNIQAVLQYELDGAFVAGPIRHPELNEEGLVEELTIITDTIHPPISSIQDIQTRTLLVFHAGCTYRVKLLFDSSRATMDVSLQFDDSDKETIGEERVENLVSINPDTDNGKDREDAVKAEIEDHDNKNLTITKTTTRLGMVFFFISI